MDKRILYFILFLLAGILWATMDEIRFHFSKVFGKLIKNKKIRQWFDPSVSWKNKYNHKSKFVRWLFVKPLAFVTDFWHFLKALLVFDISLFGVLATDNPWWYSIPVFAALGLLEEIVWHGYGILNKLLSKHNTKKSKKAVSKANFLAVLADHKPNRFVQFMYNNFGKRVKYRFYKVFSILFLVATFILGMLGTILEWPRYVVSMATGGFAIYLSQLVISLFLAVTMNNVRLSRIRKELGISKAEYAKLVDKYINE